MSSLAMHFTLLDVTCNSWRSFCPPLKCSDYVWVFSASPRSVNALNPGRVWEVLHALRGVKARKPFHFVKTITNSRMREWWNRGLILLVRNQCYKLGSLHIGFKFVGILLYVCIFPKFKIVITQRFVVKPNNITWKIKFSTKFQILLLLFTIAI